MIMEVNSASEVRRPISAIIRITKVTNAVAISGVLVCLCTLLNKRGSKPLELKPYKTRDAIII